MKNFLTNTWTQVVAWILWVASTVVLVLGGVSETEISSVLAMVLGVVAGVSALVIAIAKLIKKKE